MNSVNLLYRSAWFRYATRALVAALFLGPHVAACSAPASGNDDNNSYKLLYRIDLDAKSQMAQVTVDVDQDRHLLREMRFPGEAIEMLGDSGHWLQSDGNIVWQVPPKGGQLKWQVQVPHRRDANTYDAWLGNDWGLFRLEDVIPRAATRTLKGAVSDTRFRISPPTNWSVITEYFNDNGWFFVSTPGRRFAQPAGWTVAGKLGIRRDRIAGVRVAVAAPTGQSVHRLDMLALLNWTLPELERIVPSMPDRLTIVSASDYMWRGGLSAPQSLYIHADRPLISENGTSTLLHEVMHVVIGRQAQYGYDWLLEGFAEYYSIELLRRSGSLSPSRYQRGLESLRDWASNAETLCAPASSGARTAKAVILLSELDRFVRTESGGEHNLDDVLAALIDEPSSWDVALLNQVIARLTGSQFEPIAIDNLPGCRKLAN